MTEFIDEWWLYPLLVAVGFTVGFINTLAGGASLLSLPVLIFLGLPAAVANGTNRVAIVVQTALGVAGFKSKGVSTFPFNLYLGIAAGLGSLIGANLAVDIDEQTFKRVLSIIMIIVIAVMFIKPKANLEVWQERLTGKYLWLGCFVFFCVGIYGGFINAGVGFFIIFYLHLVHRMSLVRVNATKVAVVCIYTLIALAIFIYNDKVIWTIGLVLALGQGDGAWVASRFSVDKGDGFIRWVLIIMICVMAVKLWFFD